MCNILELSRLFVCFGERKFSVPGEQKKKKNAALQFAKEGISTQADNMYFCNPP